MSEEEVKVQEYLIDKPVDTVIINGKKLLDADIKKIKHALKMIIDEESKPKQEYLKEG